MEGAAALRGTALAASACYAVTGDRFRLLCDPNGP